ncbi:MAG: hypothetical protein AW10_02843 [Candidatus Accumulibacter appositus]|uniref:Uncharacterized protein n=2 Tax=Candidatus Accumulibacter TaxID=327159 RepID=A0A011QIL2_9PROT|nr:MAG: hypothetical protein AW10_02843 [Candidatus Accumulibacter appositus]HRF03348.1 hypothetical protein [Accumulibacter sp.]
MGRRFPILPLLVLIVGGLIFWLGQSALKSIKRSRPNAEIEVALPIFVQVTLAGGDRYLAANWSVIRALVTETSRMAPEEYHVLGQVQKDASWLNPAHEDNYYIATAILPWEGQVEPTQLILRRATFARFFDYQPPFYYAFNLVHFMGDVFGASEWLRQAAGKLPDPDERLTMESLAASWLDRSKDLDMAARIVDAMAAQAKRKDFADYLRQRSQRLRDLAALRRAAKSYSEQRGSPPRSLQDLLNSGLIDKLPVDPFGAGFAIDADGQPVFISRLRK